MKTIKRHLQDIPDPIIRAAALRWSEHSPDYELARAFVWGETTEGHDFWARCANAALEQADATAASLLAKLEKVTAERDALSAHLRSAVPGLAYVVELAKDHLQLGVVSEWQKWIDEAHAILHQHENKTCNEP